MEWLHPKWHGTFEELLAFSKACRDTKNWRAGITLLSALPYLYVAQQLPAQQQPLFYRMPAVQNPITEVYTEYLQHYPHDHARRTEHAIWSYMFGEPERANKEFDLLGENVIRPFWIEERALTEMRDWLKKALPPQ
jgi:hypothetical protein